MGSSKTERETNHVFVSLAAAERETRGLLARLLRPRSCGGPSARRLLWQNKTSNKLPSEGTSDLATPQKRGGTTVVFSAFLSHCTKPAGLPFRLPFACLGEITIQYRDKETREQRGGGGTLQENHEIFFITCNPILEDSTQEVPQLRVKQRLHNPLSK